MDLRLGVSMTGSRVSPFAAEKSERSVVRVYHLNLGIFESGISV